MNQQESLISRVESCLQAKLKLRNHHVNECVDLLLNLLHNKSPKFVRDELLRLGGDIPVYLLEPLNHIWRYRIVDLHSEQEKLLQAGDTIRAYLISDEFNSWMSSKKVGTLSPAETLSTHELRLSRLLHPLVTHPQESLLTKEADWSVRWQHAMETAFMLNKVVYELTTVSLALEKGCPPESAIADFALFDQNNYSLDSGYNWEFLLYWAINER